jgi:hypothetical protein
VLYVWHKSWVDILRHSEFYLVALTQIPGIYQCESIWGRIPLLFSKSRDAPRKKGGLRPANGRARRPFFDAAEGHEILEPIERPKAFAGFPWRTKGMEQAGWTSDSGWRGGATHFDEHRCTLAK